MPKRVNGDDGPVLVATTVETSPTRGTVVTQKWEGATDADAVTLHNSLTLSGWSVKRTSGPKWTIEATIGGDGTTGTPLPQATDSFELVFEESNKDFLEASHLLTDSLADSHKKKLRAYMNDPDSYTAFTGETVDSRSSSEYLWKLWLAGFRSLEISQPVFRINRQVDQGYSTQWAYTNVGKVMRTSKMIADSFAPATFLIALTSIGGNPGGDPIRADGLLVAYGWKKYAPTLTLAGYDKQQIQQQYKFGLWDSVLYNVPLL